MKLRIVRTHSHSIAHRRGVWVCPHCDWEDKGEMKYTAFRKTACTLVLETVHGKHGSLVVVSECPECFKKSWCHEDFHAFSDHREDYPEEWKKAAQEEYTRRHTGAVSRFADSLCAKCVHLRKLECDTLPIVRCTKGKKPPKEGKFYLSSCFTETECSAFSPRNHAVSPGSENEDPTPSPPAVKRGSIKP